MQGTHKRKYKRFSARWQGRQGAASRPPSPPCPPPRVRSPSAKKKTQTACSTPQPAPPPPRRHSTEGVKVCENSNAHRRYGRIEHHWHLYTRVRQGARDVGMRERSAGTRMTSAASIARSSRFAISFGRSGRCQHALVGDAALLHKAPKSAANDLRTGPRGRRQRVPRLRPRHRHPPRPPRRACTCPLLRSKRQPYALRRRGTTFEQRDWSCPGPDHRHKVCTAFAPMGRRPVWVNPESHMRGPLAAAVLATSLAIVALAASQVRCPAGRGFLSGQAAHPDGRLWPGRGL